MISPQNLLLVILAALENSLLLIQSREKQNVSIVVQAMISNISKPHRFGG